MILSWFVDVEVANSAVALMGVVDILKENPIWYCERCTNPIHDESQASVV